MALQLISQPISQLHRNYIATTSRPKASTSKLKSEGLNIWVSACLRHCALPCKFACGVCVYELVQMLLQSCNSFSSFRVNATPSKSGCGNPSKSGCRKLASAALSLSLVYGCGILFLSAPAFHSNVRAETDLVLSQREKSHDIGDVSPLSPCAAAECHARCSRSSSRL